MNFPDANLPEFVIVDDCDDDTFELRYRLRLGGVANPVTTFSSSADALSYLMGLYGPVPQLVFIDIKDRGAFDLIATVRDSSRFDDTKVVAITYSNDPSDLKRALECRVDGYLMKFPDADILSDYVQHGPWFDVATRPSAVSHVLCA